MSVYTVKVVGLPNLTPYRLRLMSMSTVKLIEILIFFIQSDITTVAYCLISKDF